MTVSSYVPRLIVPCDAGPSARVRDRAVGAAVVVVDLLNREPRRRRGADERVVDGQDLDRPLVWRRAAHRRPCRGEDGESERRGEGPETHAGLFTTTAGPASHVLETGPVGPVVREIARSPDVEGARASAAWSAGARRPQERPSRRDPRRRRRGELSRVRSGRAVATPGFPPKSGTTSPPHRAGGWSGRPAAPRWVGIIPYEATRGIERSGWTRSPDDRPPPRSRAPHGAATMPSVRVDHASGRVVVEADDDRAAQRLAQQLERR